MSIGKNLFVMEYYNTYFFAHILNKILTNQFSYLRFLDEFYGGDNIDIFFENFSKFSALHKFIEFCIDNYLQEGLDNIALDSFVNSSNHSFWLEQALEYHGVKYERLEHWLDTKGKSIQEADEDDLYDYYMDLELDGTLDQLKQHIIQEVFFIVFLNRRLLHAFNEMVARQIKEIIVDSSNAKYFAVFEKDGVLKRTHIPTWAQKAVFYRDRGCCVLCQKDLSRLLSIYNESHFDHMVPLIEGGINDVTNLQLLCDECNLKKGGNLIDTSNLYEMWY